MARPAGKVINKGAHSPAERARVEDRHGLEDPAPDKVEGNDPRVSPAAEEALAKGGLEPSNAPDASRHPLREDYGRGSREGSKTAIREADLPGEKRDAERERRRD